MQDHLAHLTSFNNRHYTTSTGKAASQYIFDTVTAVRLPSPTHGCHLFLRQ